GAQCSSHRQQKQRDERTDCLAHGRGVRCGSFKDRFSVAALLSTCDLEHARQSPGPCARTSGICRRSDYSSTRRDTGQVRTFWNQNGRKWKYVVSSTLNRGDWNAEPVRGDPRCAVRQRKPLRSAKVAVYASWGTCSITHQKKSVIGCSIPNRFSFEATC